MKTAPLLLTLFATAGLLHAASALAAESRYTNLGNQECKLDQAASGQIKPHEDFKPLLYRCNGLGERQVSVTYHGLMVRTTLARADGKSLDVLTPYDAGPRIEWRGEGRSSAFAPTAAILRLSARGDDGRPASALAVLKLTPEQDCLLAIIDVKANRNANELARDAADAAATASCGSARMIGATGSTGTEILDLNKR
ncbi:MULTISPECIES: hypothetical protein [unclassified Beijerinckia]|uniref:hypothetical protein n=1 Tax=unclassified Beijerinckia TaxID=2638183 RepID=UPI0008999AE8|nr:MULTISPECIES: hypothetical protein [unclassified Beijerinckia]MDH7795264.1 hypothetical protein [Beijerinckia sp. GAS462]SEB94326.1 hypothetical protein SAMN05443249_1537 [Beijerinckia sp. 28-YEA-48]